MIENLYNLKENLAAKGIFFCFCGPISQELIVEIGATLKQKMKLEEASNKTVVRLFSLVVEKAQNIIHYSAEKIASPDADSDLGLGIIVVGREEDHHYFVQCGNMMLNQDVARLKEKLVRLQNMTRDELKLYYREQRRKEPDEGSKGAGLGLIEVARKAERPIEFDFKNINDRFSFFATKTVI